jgi:replicative DNA helicase
MVNTAFDAGIDEPATAQIEDSEQGLFNLAEHGRIEGGFRPFSASLNAAVEMAEAAYKRDGEVTGVATGFADLDSMLGGLHRSDLIVLAGRPSMGKTALATNIAFSAASAYRAEKNAEGETETVDGAVVGFFSLEMAAEQLAMRILGEASGIPSEKVRRGQLSESDFLKVVTACQQLENTPFFIDDTPALTVAALRTRARRLKRQHRLGMVVVDYLQLLNSTGRYDNRVLEISEVTRGLKALAKELDVPVLALSQLSRAVEQREDKRPLLSDLRESGAIEQDADVVLFIYREEYYLERRQPEPGTEAHESWQQNMDRVHNVAEIIVGKQRHGPTGLIKLQFQGETTTFHDLDRAEQLPDARF